MPSLAEGLLVTPCLCSHAEKLQPPGSPRVPMHLLAHCEVKRGRHECSCRMQLPSKPLQATFSAMAKKGKKAAPAEAPKKKGKKKAAAKK